MKRTIIHPDRDSDEKLQPEVEIERICQEVRTDKLAVLDLSGIEIGDKIKPIINAIRICENLNTVILDYSEIGVEEVNAVLMAIKVNPRIIELSLTGNGIDKIGVKSIATFLAANDTLKNIHLDFNFIGNEGLKFISQALKTNSTLQTIDLAGNSITNIDAFADALKVNATLKEVSLSANIIRNKGVIQISKVLKRNTTLRYIHLRSCAIDDLGGKALAEAIRSRSPNDDQVNIDFRWNLLRSHNVARLFFHSPNVELDSLQEKMSGLSLRKHL